MQIQLRQTQELQIYTEDKVDLQWEAMICPQTVSYLNIIHLVRSVFVSGEQ